MQFTREELAMIQDALYEKAIRLRAGSSTFVSKYQRVAALRDKIQSHLLSDAIPDTKRCPVSA
jgi:hypothetical protein